MYKLVFSGNHFIRCNNSITGGNGMAINKVEICGVNTSKLPVLNNEEKEELFKRYYRGIKKQGNHILEEISDWFLVLYKDLIIGEHMDDLFQVGCIGLIKAIDNFDISQNVKFSTYAVPMIIGEIRRYLRDNNSIRVSRSLRDTAYKALQVRKN